MKPICVPCERFYRPKRNGTAFIEGMPIAASVPPGKAQPEDWHPYKLWMGDLWECPTCGSQVIVGVAPEPLGEHYQDKFKDQVRTYAPKLMVKDC